MAGSAFSTGYLSESDRTQLGDQTDLYDFVSDPLTRWARFFFSEEDEGVGDAAVNPFGDEVEYKLNAINYNLYFGDNLKFPFQLYFADIDSSESPADANEAKVLDPTQGVAIQFPVAYVYRGKGEGGFCNFSELKGYCVVGGDVTARGVQLSERTDEGGISKSFVFGGSVSLRAAALFPIFQKGVPGGSQSGHLSASIGVRYYYQDADQQDLLFGEITDPDGSAIEFKNDFGAFSLESEFDIYKHFKIRLEYFQPISNRDSLDDVFKASLVLSAK